MVHAKEEHMDRASTFSTVVCISLLMSAPVWAAPVLDQYQDGADAKALSYWDGVLLGQTFTAGQSGVLDHVSIGQTVGMSDIGTPIGTWPTTIEIRDTTAEGLPGETVLGTAYAPSGFTDGWNDISFLSQNIAITPDTTYAITLQNQNASYSNYAHVNWDPASYTDGALWYKNGATPWNPDFSFVNVDYAPGGDMQFRTYIVPPEQPTIPAPGALLLTCLGTAAAGWFRRR
jgi:hypothetical protein